MKQITDTRAARAKKMNSEQGWHRNTETFVDLKSILRSDRVPQPGRDYNGVLRRELPVEDNAFEDWHYTFLETQSPKGCHRNPRLYDGVFITMTRTLTGGLRLNFRRCLKPSENFSLDEFIGAVADELRDALEGLVEE